jgi:hypothetical protein
MCALLAVAGWSPQRATAQEPSIVITAPNQSGSSREVWFEQDLADAQDRVRRSRNALIGTSAAFGVGLILAGIGASQCQVVSRINQNDELLCNNAGKVLLPLGGTFVGLGAIGMITSGIILGVANKRKREIQRDMRRAQYGERRLRWDVRSNAVVF